MSEDFVTLDDIKQDIFLNPKKLRKKLMEKTGDLHFVEVAMKIHRMQNPELY